MTRLDAEHVSWFVGSTAIVDEVSLSAAGGEFIAVMGKNGAGKSTLLDLLAGVRPLSHGSITIDGRSLHERSAIERARCVTHLPQMTRDRLPFTVAQTVAMGRYAHGGHRFETAVDRAAIARAMTRCECVDWAARPMAGLSAGERQRVLLAACLAQDAPVLLLDEPSTFLDIDQQLQCFSLLAEEAAAGRLCIAVTHDVNLALMFCSRLLILSDRKIAVDQAKDAAAADPGWLRLLSSRLSLDARENGSPRVVYR